MKQLEDYRKVILSSSRGKLSDIFEHGSKKRSQYRALSDDIEQQEIRADVCSEWCNLKLHQVARESSSDNCPWGYSLA